MWNNIISQLFQPLLTSVWNNFIAARENLPEIISEAGRRWQIFFGMFTVAEIISK